MPRLAAVTGATGFLGRHLLAALASSGLRLRILSRRDPADRTEPGLAPELVRGDLEDAPALARLVGGADIVIHAAGLIRAGSRREFLSVNRDGASRLAEAVRRQAPSAHLIGISSLAARAPRVSAYAESKRAGEVALMAFGGRLSILRLPVIYGAWDRETLGIFRTAARSVVPVPGPAWARIAMIGVEEAAAAIAAIAAWDQAPRGATHALADCNPCGYAPRDIMEMAASALGNRPRFIHMPVPAVRLAGWAASGLAWMRGRPASFNSGKAREMAYGRWGVATSELLPRSVFTPETDLRLGFAAAVAWYRRVGWLEKG